MSNSSHLSLDYTPNSPPDARPAPARGIRDAIDRPAIVRPPLSSQEARSSAKTRWCRLRGLIGDLAPSISRSIGLPRRPRPPPGGPGLTTSWPYPWAPPQSPTRSLYRRGASFVQSVRRHAGLCRGVARISSLVVCYRSSPSTRGCTGRCPTLPRPSLYSGRRRSLLYCLRFREKWLVWRRRVKKPSAHGRL